MSLLVCGGGAPPGAPDTGGWCCEGAALVGPEDCTCWEPVYEPAGQAQPVDGPGQVRPEGMCGDCAYRPGSPEKAGTEGYSGDAFELERLAESGKPFHCHDGMRRVVQYRHSKTGQVIDAPPSDYAPVTRGPVAYRADGSPAFLCAGWDARRRALDRAAKKLTPKSLGLSKVMTGTRTRDYAWRGHGYSLEPGTNRYWRLIRVARGEQLATASTLGELLEQLAVLLEEAARA